MGEGEKSPINSVKFEKLERPKIIRVLVVDDSPLAREVITGILRKDSQIEIVGEAEDGQEAVEMVPQLKPDLITMDIHMSNMDGYEATRQIMAYHPTPILVISSSALTDRTGLVFKALMAGALDIKEKPFIGVNPNLAEAGKDLVKSVKLLSKIKVITHLAGLNQPKTIKEDLIEGKRSSSKVVAIASSTGGPEALAKILPRLPRNFPASIVVTQHMTEGFVEGFASWLDQESKIKVKMAQEGEKIKPGVSFVSPAKVHMKVEQGGRIKWDNSSHIELIRPSANILFTSVAKSYGPKAIGLVLSGMGKDGAEGIKDIKMYGGITLAQEKKSCVVFGMPKAAIATGTVDKVLPAEAIAEELMKVV